MAEKKFFDMSPKQSLVMGLSWGIAAVAIIALIVTVSGGPATGNEGAVLGAEVNANTNVNTNTQPAQVATVDVSKLSPVTDDDYIQGNKNAKVTLIEISDFQCPYCERHVPTIEQILKEYGDQVRVVWRHFPLTSIHPYAQKAAEAAECAGEQGKFWEMHDILFDNQSALDTASLKSYAKDLGLNQTQFDSCLDDGKYTSKVQAQAQEAVAAGVTGTPATFVNSQIVKGAYPFDTFKQIIDAELAK